MASCNGEFERAVGGGSGPRKSNKARRRVSVSSEESRSARSLIAVLLFVHEVVKHYWDI